MAQTRKTGRPPFVATSAMRRRVSICANAMTHEELASALGIPRSTLEKHFPKELTTGRSERRQEIVEAMFKTAKKGNISAQKAYIALCDAGKETIILPPAPKPEPVGKKQQANLDAIDAQAGTDWHELLTPGRPQ